VASYTVNKAAVARARELIERRRYVLDSDWGDANEEAKARHALVFGDFHRVHRSGIIACLYRAAEWRHKDVERAAYDLLQRLDEKSA
jgi:hypothetical protein